MSDALESLGSARTQGLVLVIAVFLAGLGAGAAGGIVWATHARGPGRSPARAMRGPGPMGPHSLPPFFERLALSGDQEKRIRAILDQARPRTDSIMRATMPHLRAITDSVESQIDAVLSPAQREQLKEERARFPGPGGPGGPMGGPEGPGGRGGRRGFGPGPGGPP